MKHTNLIVSVILLTGISVSANLLVEEAFNYSTGSLNGQNGGLGFSTVWNAPGDPGEDQWVVDGTSLDNVANPFSIVGGSARYDVPPGANNATANRDLTTVFEPEASGAGNVWYMSFLLSIPDPANQILRLRLTEKDGSGGDLDFENNGTAARIDTGGVNFSESSNAFTAATTYFNVIKIDGSSASVAATTIGWDIYTSGSVAASDPGTGNYDVNLTAANMNSNWDFGRLELITGAADSNVQIDQIRIGTSYSSVTAAVPEPGTLALICSALGVIGLYRRRWMTTRAKK